MDTTALLHLLDRIAGHPDPLPELPAALGVRPILAIITALSTPQHDLCSLPDILGLRTFADVERLLARPDVQQELRSWLAVSVIVIATRRESLRADALAALSTAAKLVPDTSDPRLAARQAETARRAGACILRELNRADAQARASTRASAGVDTSRVPLVPAEHVQRIEAEPVRCVTDSANKPGSSPVSERTASVSERTSSDPPLPSRTLHPLDAGARSDHRTRKPRAA